MSGTHTAAVASLSVRFEGCCHRAAAQIAMRVIGADAPARALAMVGVATGSPTRPKRRSRAWKLADGLVEVLRVEVGPEHVGEVELGVGEPVEEEVRDAALAAGADDQIGVADGEARHARVEALGRHFVAGRCGPAATSSASSRAAAAISSRPP